MLPIKSKSILIKPLTHRVLAGCFRRPLWQTWLPRWLSGKESTCQCKKRRRLGFVHRVRKIPWRRKWQPTPVFLPGTSHGQRSLAGYSPWGCKELDTTEQAHASHPLSYIELAKKFFWFFPEDVTEKPNRTFLVNLIQARAYINAQSACCARGRAETQAESLCGLSQPCGLILPERTKPWRACPCAEIFFTTCVGCRDGHRTGRHPVHGRGSGFLLWRSATPRCVGQGLGEGQA